MEPDNFGLVYLLVYLLVVAGLCWLYALPAIIAFRRAHPNRWAILALNVFLGSTGIGWAAALVWALHAVHRSGEVAGSHGGESGLNLFVNDVRRVRLVDGQGAPQGGSGSPLTTEAAVAEIERLGRLRAAGHLSEAEYAGLKSTVLARL